MSMRLTIDRRCAQVSLGINECDLVAAAQKLNLLQPVPSASNREEGLPAEAAKSARREVGHSLGTIDADRGSRRRASL